MPTTYDQILTDVKTVINAANSGYFSLVTRKEIIRVKEDTLPLLIMIPQSQKRQALSFENRMDVRFTVGVCMIWAGNQTLETGLTNVNDKIDLIVKAVSLTTLPTALNVWDFELDFAPEQYDAEALDKNLDYTIVDVIYRSDETRN